MILSKRSLFEAQFSRKLFCGVHTSYSDYKYFNKLQVHQAFLNQLLQQEEPVCLCCPLFSLGHLMLEDMCIIYQSLGGGNTAASGADQAREACSVLSRDVDENWSPGDQRDLVLCDVLPLQAITSIQHSHVEHSATVGCPPSLLCNTLVTGLMRLLHI